MIEFTCPGCRSAHLANAAFVGMRARCVVCGAFIRIPREGGGVAELLDGLASPALAARHGRAVRTMHPSRSGSDAGVGATTTADGFETGDDFDPDSPVDLADIEEAGEEPTTVKRASARVRSRSATRESPAVDAVGSEWGAADAAEDAPRHKPATPLPDAPDRRRLLMQIGVSAAVIAVLAVGYFIFSGDDKPAPPPVAQQLPPAPKVEPPPPKPQPLPAITAQIALRFAIMAIERIETQMGAPPVEYTAARLMADRREDSHRFDVIHTGKRLTIRGTLGNVVAGRVVLADAQPDDGVAALETIACTLWDPAAVSKFDLLTGRPITLQGMYVGDLRLLRCEILKTGSPADPEYLGREIELTGLVRVAKSDDAEGERFPYVTLEAPTTDSPLEVHFLFRRTEQEPLAKLRAGQPITIRGKCAGRAFRVVRFHDCTIVEPNSPPAASVTRVSLDRFFAAYEADLMPYERPDAAAGPIPASAEQLAAAFGKSLPDANATYRNRIIQVTGRVLSRRSGTITLETGTSQSYQIMAMFTSQRFAALKDEPVMTLRGTCVGIRQGHVRLENCDRVDTGVADATDPRVTADFLPLPKEQSLTYELLIPSRTRVQQPTVVRYEARLAEPDKLRFTAVRAGAFPAATLFGGDNSLRPRWTWDLNSKKAAPPGIQPKLTLQYRIENNFVEVREIPEPPTQPLSWRDPVLKLGLRKGEAWSSIKADGAKVSYVIVDFGRDESGRDTLHVHRAEKDPKKPDWEERTITYVRGVGEVKRVVSRHLPKQAVTALELRLVESDDDQTAPSPSPKGKGGG